MPDSPENLSSAPVESQVVILVQYREQDVCFQSLKSLEAAICLSLQRNIVDRVLASALGVEVRVAEVIPSPC